MPRIKINPSSINELSTKMRGAKSKTNNCQSSVKTVINNLDWKVSSKSSINARLENVQKRLQKQSEIMDGYLNLLNSVKSSFETKDKDINNRAKGIVYTLNNLRFSAANSRIGSGVNFTTIQKLSRIFDVNAIFGAGVSLIGFIVNISINNILSKLKRLIESLFGRKKDKDKSDSVKPKEGQESNQTQPSKTPEQYREEEIINMYENANVKDWSRASGFVKGFCAWYTYQRLHNMYGKDVFGEDVGGKATGNGNQWISWDAEGNYNGTVPKNDQQIPYHGSNALADIMRDYGNIAGPIIVSFPLSPNATPRDAFGHVMLIDAIIDGMVYWSDSGSMGVQRGPQTIDAFLSYYEKHNGLPQGAMILL